MTKILEPILLKKSVDATGNMSILEIYFSKLMEKAMSPRVNLERIAKNKVDLLAAKEEISNLVNLNKETFFSEKRNIFSLKYLLIQAVEALADTCQHLLSKLKGIPCEGYVDCLKKAEENKIIAPDLAQNLKRLADLRNILIYRYWIIDDEQLYEQTRNNLKNLEEFISQIDRFILKLR